MAEATLLVARGNRQFAHDALVAEKPEAFAPAAHPVAWRILAALHEEPDYPSHLAHRLRMHEQTV